MSTLYWVLECEPDVGSQGRRNHIFQKPFHNNLGAGYYSSKSEYRSIAQTVFKPRDDEKEDLELVLGITATGALALLVPHGESQHYPAHPRDHEPLPPSTFRSLSPVWFASADNLEASLPKYRPKRAKGFRRTGENLNRAYYERNRTLYNLLIKKIQPDRFALKRDSLPLKCRFFAFAANHIFDMANIPTLFDVGWQIITASGGQFYPEKAQYFSTDHTELRAINGKRWEGHHEASASKSDIPYTSFNAQWSTEDVTILLVWGYEELTPVLRQCLGADTNNIASDLTSLLGFPYPDYHIDVASVEPATVLPKQRPVMKTTDPRRRPRERSKSPARQYSTDATPDNYRADRSSRGDSPKIAKGPSHRTYVVDLRKMYQEATTKYKSARFDDLRDVAIELNLEEMSGLSPDKWCAGNECRLLFPLWKALFSEGPVYNWNESRKQVPDASPPQQSAKKAPLPSDPFTASVRRSVAVASSNSSQTASKAPIDLGDLSDEDWF